MDQPTNLKPSILIIFGITGDLAKRKVLPALYHLCKDNLLPEGTKIVGISRQHITKEEILETVNLCVSEVDNICDPDVINKLHSWISMHKLDPSNDDDYLHLKNYLSELEAEAGNCLDRLFYLSIPPQVYAPIIEKLGQFGLNKGCEHSQAVARLLVEKPFGYDLASAELLISETEKVFSDDQVFRIDHYLAKDTAQNILKFRRHNPLFSSQWNDRQISSIHVIAKEKIGIENRVNFYETVGALRDLVQSHLLQLLALTALDMPKQLTSKQIHIAKNAFLESLIPPGAEQPMPLQVIRGQYDSYRQEVDNPESTTETFVSLGLSSQDPNWKNCRFQLTTGKSLDEKSTIIQLRFGNDDPNILSFRIQPDEGIDIDLLIEQPGFEYNLKKVKMNFSYSQDFNTNHDAYERVLVDAIRGDKLLFATKSEVMSSWRLLEPILDAWRQDSSDLVIYPSGSPGPSIASLNLSVDDKLKLDDK